MPKPWRQYLTKDEAFVLMECDLVIDAAKVARRRRAEIINKANERAEVARRALKKSPRDQ